MTGAEIVALVVSVISGLASLLAIFTFIINRRKEREEDAKWRQSVDDELKGLSERVDSHNNYAELFQQYGRDITTTKENIAFVRGLLEGKT